MTTFQPVMIGRRIKVISAKNQNNNGISGMVIDETRNMLVVSTINGEKMLMKSNIIFNTDGKIIDGCAIIGRPDERVKLQW